MNKIDSKSTAILVIDMLNDFVREDGALVVPGALDLVPKQQRILKKAREVGSLVIYITDSHLPDDPEFKMWPPHAVLGTPGSKVIEELKPEPEERVINKRRYSGFFGTDLDLTLREKNIDTVIIFGVLTDICVMYTSADSSARGYNVFVVGDATWSTKKENHEFALKHIQEVHGSEVISTDEALKMLQ